MAIYRLVSLSRFLLLLVVVCTSVSSEEDVFEWPLYMPAAGTKALKVSRPCFLTMSFVHTQMFTAHFTHSSTMTIDVERPNCPQATTTSVSLQV